MSEIEQERTLKWTELSRDKRNALVHLHVFKGDFTRACSGKLDADGFCEWCKKIVDPNRPHAITIATPDYSGDIREAWRIVKHFQDVQMHYMKPGTNRYGGTNMAVINSCHRGLGSTMEEALCMAALDACGLEIEQ